MGRCDEVRLLTSNRKDYCLAMEQQAVRRLSLFTCVLLSCLIVMLFGLTLTTMYKLQKVEAQLRQMKALLEANPALDSQLEFKLNLKNEEVDDLVGYSDYNYDFDLPPLVDQYEAEFGEMESLLPAGNLTKQKETARRTKRDSYDAEENGASADPAGQSTDDYYSDAASTSYSPYEYPRHRTTYTGLRPRNHRTQPRNQEFESTGLEQDQESFYGRRMLRDRMARRMKLLPAIHVNGDTSKYVYGQHENYNGNGHLHHPNKLIVDWVAHDWVGDLGMHQYFELSDGSLTILQSGLYLVYAQIYYIDSHDMVGFSVKKNNVPVLQCVRDTKSGRAENKTNTCFTAGAEFFAEHDRISIEEIYHERYSVFRPGKSFFGAIKMGDHKP